MGWPYLQFASQNQKPPKISEQGQTPENGFSALRGRGPSATWELPLLTLRPPCVVGSKTCTCAQSPTQGKVRVRVTEQGPSRYCLHHWLDFGWGGGARVCPPHPRAVSAVSWYHRGFFWIFLAYRYCVRDAQLRTFCSSEGSASCDRNSRFYWIFGGLGQFRGRPGPETGQKRRKGGYSRSEGPFWVRRPPTKFDRMLNARTR